MPIVKDRKKEFEKIKDRHSKELFLNQKEFIKQALNFSVVELAPKPTFRTSETFEFYIKPQPSFNKQFDLLIENFLQNTKDGYTNYLFCDSEKQARSVVSNDILSKKWPCFFTLSDTTGEKSFEEFYMPNETLDLQTFEKLGIVKSEADFNNDQLNYFLNSIETMRNQNSWSKESIVSLFFEMLPELNYEDKGKYLDSKM